MLRMRDRVIQVNRMMPGHSVMDFGRTPVSSGAKRHRGREGALQVEIQQRKVGRLFDG